jgi:hypothetical protein
MSKADLLVGELPCDLQDVRILGSPRVGISKCRPGSF